MANSAPGGASDFKPRSLRSAAMAAWKDVEQAEPEFAARVRRLFEAGRDKTIATGRAGGAPRVSGIGGEVAHGQPRVGGMRGGREGAGLRRGAGVAPRRATGSPPGGQQRAA